MNNRKSIEIDENKCFGCGVCTRGCGFGVIGIVNGKAKLLDKNRCDGAGVCIAYCPHGAISLG